MRQQERKGHESCTRGKMLLTQGGRRQWTARGQRGSAPAHPPGGRCRAHGSSAHSVIHSLTPSLDSSLVCLFADSLRTSQPSQPSDEHSFSFSRAPSPGTRGTRVAAWVRRAGPRLARAARAGPDVLCTLQGLSRVCLCRPEPSLWDSGQRPAGQGRSPVGGGELVPLVPGVEQLLEGL